MDAQRGAGAGVAETADPAQPEGVVGEGVDAGVAVEAEGFILVWCVALAGGGGVGEGEDVEGFEEGGEVDFEDGRGWRVVLRGGWWWGGVGVGGEEGFVEEDEGFHCAAFFGTEADAVRRDADLSFFGEGDAAEEEEELAGGGCDGGEEGWWGCHVGGVWMWCFGLVRGML